jgi:hypothetical protein
VKQDRNPAALLNISAPGGPMHCSPDEPPGSRFPRPSAHRMFFMDGRNQPNGHRAWRTERRVGARLFRGLRVVARPVLVNAQAVDLYIYAPAPSKANVRIRRARLRTHDTTGGDGDDAGGALLRASWRPRRQPRPAGDLSRRICTRLAGRAPPGSGRCGMRLLTQLAVAVCSSGVHVRFGGCHLRRLALCRGKRRIAAGQRSWQAACRVGAP